MAHLSPDGFADRFNASAQALWCIAAAVVGNSSQADDVLQEAAMIALGKLDQFDPETQFAAWMGRIVRYAALNARRRGGLALPVDPERLSETVESPPRSAPPQLSGRGELTPDQSAFDDRVLAALGDLDDTARACLLLRTVMEMPYREMALALDIPEGTAMSHVHRARRTLSRRLFGDRQPSPVGSGGSHA